MSYEVKAMNATTHAVCPSECECVRIGSLGVGVSRLRCKARPARTPGDDGLESSSPYFPRPDSPEKLARVSRDLRYFQQIQRHGQRSILPASSDYGAESFAPPAVTGNGKTIKRDWPVDLGAGGSAGAGTYPAKFSFRGATANCASAG